MHPRFRIMRFLSILTLAAVIAFLPSCSKKQASSGGGDPIVAPNMSTDYLLFAHLNARQIRNHPIFTELKNAFLKQGEQNAWDEIEKEAAEKIGLRPSQFESVTFVVTDVPAKDEPPMILILVADSPIQKQLIFGKPVRTSPDQPGFYEAKGDMLVHFPDDKTLVMLHHTLVKSYLAGYAKNRSGWPLNDNLIKASQEHTLLAILNPSKLPADMRQERGMEPFLPLFDAKSATLTLDLKDREFSGRLRATFANAEAANAAKAALSRALNEAAQEVASTFKTPRDTEKLGSGLPLVKEAYRALTEANIAVSGTEVTASMVYKANFNLGELVKDAVEKVRIAASRTQAYNNLKQIGLALHNYASASADAVTVPVHGVAKNGERIIAQFGKNGEPIYNPKPLLSWRVAILPYIEQAPLYNEFKLDEPWDSEHNKKLIPRMPKLYAPVTKALPPGMTHMQQIIGPTCLLPGRYSIATIPDGTSNTIAVAEAAEPVIWTKPDDVLFTETAFDAPPPKDLKKRFGGYYENGAIVLMWDGSVRFVDLRFVSDKTLWNALRPADGIPLGSDWY